MVVYSVKGSNHQSIGPSSTQQGRTKVMVVALALMGILIIAGSAIPFSPSEADDSNYTYMDNSTGVTITGYTGSLSGNVTIPSTLGGKSVTEIDSYAFKDQTGITSLTIPDSVQNIREYAFIGCTNITDLTVNASLNAIEKGSFDGCTAISFTSNNLKYLIVNDKALVIGYESEPAGILAIPDMANGHDVEGVGSHAFEYCDDITGLDLGSVEFLADGAFSGCGIIGHLNLSNITHIGAGTFGSCSKITSVTFGDSITGIGSSAFSYCTGLDGALIIPSNVKNIGVSAFAVCSGIDSIIFNGKVDGIQASAFQGCTSISALTFNNGVGTIENDAFSLGFGSINVSCIVNGLSHDRLKTASDDMTEFTYNLKVTYYADGIIEEITAKKGDSFTVIECSITKSEHEFIGWEHKGHIHQPGDHLIVGNDDIALYALWDDIKHTVIYKHHDGTIVDTVAYNEGDIVTVGICECTGHDGENFAGWNVEGTDTFYHPGDVFTMGGSDMTLIGQWVEQPLHSITYLTDGGNQPAPTHSDVVHGGTMIIKQYFGTNDGHDCLGWDYNGTLYRPGDVLIITEDTVLTAVWDEPKPPIFIPIMPEKEFIPPIYVIEEEKDNTWIVVVIATVIALFLIAYLAHDMRKG